MMCNNDLGALDEEINLEILKGCLVIVGTCS